MGLRRSLWLRVAAGAVALLGVALAALAGDIALYARTTDTAPAEAAIVLGAAVWGDRPSPVLEERLRHAVALYQAGQVRVLVFTGGLAPGDDYSEGEAGRRYALAHGVSAPDILWEDRSTTTQENLREAQRLIQAAHLSRVLIVSDPLHMRRAITVAHDLGLDAHPSPTPTTRYRSLRSQAAFLWRETYFYAAYLGERLFRR